MTTKSLKTRCVDPTRSGPDRLPAIQSNSCSHFKQSRFDRTTFQLLYNSNAFISFLINKFSIEDRKYPQKRKERKAARWANALQLGAVDYDERRLYGARSIDVRLQNSGQHRLLCIQRERPLRSIILAGRPFKNEGVISISDDLQHWESLSASSRSYPPKFVAVGHSIAAYIFTPVGRRLDSITDFDVKFLDSLTLFWGGGS